MPLRDLLKKKDRVKDAGQVQDEDASNTLPAGPPALPEFTFIRSTTNTQELISPPSFGSDERTRESTTLEGRRRHSPFRSSSPKGSPKKSDEKRLSHRLHFRSPSSHSRASSNASSVNVPADLPSVADSGLDKVEKEARWEERATLLARSNPNSRPATPLGGQQPETGMILGLDISEGDQTTGRNRGISVSSKQGDEDIQEAIRLHEAGDLERSTELFSRLADPAGANNPLSQVLYGLALRHGWGCTPDQTKAITYLSYAASNSAAVETLALKAGMKKGGAAKGELVLAIYELANCFRHGWGVESDPAAARQYYETAANLGDTDAMNEVAWCYLEGFGVKKDKYTAAKYYRLAEQNGSKTLGNSW